MTSLPVSSRRARRIADALDGRTSHSRDEALREEEVGLVELSTQLRTLAPQPPPGFVQALRERLMVAAFERELDLVTAERELDLTSPEPSPQRSRPRPALIGPALASALATVLMVGGGAVGLTAVSAQSQPGDMLYPVKRGVERVDLALQGSPEAAGLVLLDHAGTRLTELEGLLSGGRPDRRDEELAIATLNDFAAATSMAGEALNEAARERPLAPATTEQLNGFLADAADRLAQVAPVLPPDAAAAFGRAAGAVNDLDRQVSRLCGLCGRGGSGDLVKLVAAPATVGEQNVAPPTVRKPSNPGPSARPDRARYPDTDRTDRAPAAPGPASGPPRQATVPPAPDQPDADVFDPPAPPQGPAAQGAESGQEDSQVGLPQVPDGPGTGTPSTSEDSGPPPSVPVPPVPIPEVEAPGSLLP